MSNKTTSKSSIHKESYYKCKIDPFLSFKNENIDEEHDFTRSGKDY
jgi:hypothetical protein